MSVVIAACTNEYGFIMADTRMVSKLDNSVIVSENIEKIKVLSDYVCLGYAGDGEFIMSAVKHISFSRNDCLEECSLGLLRAIERVKAILMMPQIDAHFILLGKKKAGSLGIIKFSSSEDFQPYLCEPQIELPAYAMSIPRSDSGSDVNYSDELVKIIKLHKTDIELAINLKSRLVSLAEISTTVNDNIIVYQVSANNGVVLKNI